MALSSLKGEVSAPFAICCAIGLVLALATRPLHAHARQTQDSPSAAEHLTGGLALLKAGKAREALPEFKEACRLDPGSSQAFVLLGMAEQQLGDDSAAIAALRHALRLDPASAVAHYNLAMSLARLNRSDEAIRELRSVLKLNPQSVSAHYNLGVLLLGKGDNEGAIGNLLLVVNARPDDTAALVYLINAYYGAGDTKRAVGLAEEAASRDAEGSIAVRIAQVMIRYDDFERAAQLLEEARARLPASAPLDLTLARAYIGAGQPGKALELLKAKGTANASWQSAYLTGMAYLRKNEAQPALSAFRHAVRLNPDQPAPHFELGKLLLLQGTDQTDERTGVQELSRAIALDPHNSEYHEVLGRWFLEHEDLKAAIEVLQKGIQDGTPSPEIEAMMALAEAALYGGTSARPFAEKALQLDPGLPIARYLVGFCYFSAGAYAEAVKYYEQAAELDPGNDVYAYNTAVALERLNRIGEALPYARKSTELNPERSLNHYLLGKLYAKLNRDAAAILELGTSIRLNPNLDNSYYLLAQAYERTGNATKAQEMLEKLAQLKCSEGNAVHLQSPESEPGEMISPSRLLHDSARR